MKQELGKTELTDNQNKQRFEMELDGQIAFVEYQVRPGAIKLTHTEVPRSLEGQGVGSALVEKVFTTLEGRGEKIVPLCAFIKVYLKRHPEWNRIVA